MLFYVLHIEGIVSKRFLPDCNTERSRIRMNAKRYYFRLKKPLPELCIDYGKRPPKRDSLRTFAGEFTFHNEEYRFAVGDERGPISDGVLHSIATFLEARPEDIAVPTSDQPERLLNNASDIFLRGWTFIQGLFARDFMVHDRSHLRNDDEVKKAAEDINLGLGWQIAIDMKHDPSDRYTEEELHELASRSSGMSLSEFQETLLGWWRVNPRTTMAAYGRNNTRLGATCLLPITDLAFDRIRRGEIGIRDIHKNDICLQEQSFLLVGCGDRAHAVNDDMRKITKSLASCLLSQLAHAVEPGREREIRGLSFASTTVARERLTSGGFEPLPTRLKGTKWDLHEFHPNNPGGVGLVKGILIARQKMKI